MATIKTIQRDLSMDTDPFTPERDIGYRPSYTSLNISNISADALAGPLDASRRSTQELKQEAKLAEMKQKKRRPSNLKIDNLSQKSYSKSRSSGQNELDQVESEIQSKVEDMSISKGGDSSYCSMSSSESPGDSFSCSSMPSASWEDELKLHTDEMPPEIRMGYIDVLILYCEDDRKKAEKFKEHLIKDITVPNGPVLALLYDDAEMQAICGSKIQHLAKGVERSTYMFLFMTKKFIQSKWCEFSTETCLMEALQNPDKRWCVVPVYTKKRTELKVMGLNTLKGIDFFNIDTFYKTCVSRLIGDKVYVRISKNKEHMFKQKKWLEKKKRKEILQTEMKRKREEERRLEAHEKAKTQQLMDWNVIPHSSSESDLSYSGSDMTHSSSTSSLKPVHPQNLAEAAYFQHMLNEQKLNGWNSNNYTPQEIQVINQMYGGNLSPFTPGLYSNNSPLMMNQYQNQFAPGNFPPVPNSALYQQNQHNVKRSMSQTSANMGFSTQFMLYTETGETGDVSVPVLSELVDRIKGESEKDQQQHLRSYLKQVQQKEQQQAVLQNQPRYGPGTPSPRYESSIQPQDFGARQGNTGQLSGNPNLIPNFDTLNHSNEFESFHTNSSTSMSSRSLPSGLSGPMPSSQHLSEPGLGSNVDENRSNLGGNIPMLRSLSLSSNEPDNDGDLCLPPQAQPYPVTERRKQAYEQKSVGDSGSDDEEPKKRHRQSVNIYNSYQSDSVQIGEHNMVLEQGSEQLGDEHSEEEEESISLDSVVRLPEDKTGTAKDASVSDEKSEKVKSEGEQTSELIVTPTDAAAGDITVETGKGDNMGNNSSTVPVVGTSIHTIRNGNFEGQANFPDTIQEKKDIDDVLLASSFWTKDMKGTVELHMTESGPGATKPKTLPTVLKDTVHRLPNNVALAVKREGEWKKWTYKQYYDQSVQAAKGFIKLGLEQYHGLGILGFNSPEWYIAYVGAIFAGGKATGIYTTNTAEACEYVLSDCEANVIVVENHMQLQKIVKVWDKLPKLKAIVQYIGEVAERREGIYSWDELLALSKEVTDEELDQRLKMQAPNTCCSLIYTSGTTGNPKAVMISHDNCTWTAEQTGKQLQYKDGAEIGVTFLPLSHIAAQMLDILMPLRFGASIYFAQPDALKGTLLDTLKEVRPTGLLAVPRVWEKIMEKMQGVAAQTTGIKRKIAIWAKGKGKKGVEAQRNGGSLPWGWSIANALLFKKVRANLGLDRCRLVGSAAAPIMRETLEYFAVLNIRIDECYGMSESSGPHTFCTDKEFRITSVGKELPGVKTKLDNPDEDGNGEICFFGRHVFMGYLNQEEKTKEAIDEQGWLHSGDVGKKDKDGFLYITGRIKEIIITAGGENIAPVPLEDNVKEALPCVSNCMLIGDKRKFLSMLITLKCNMNLDTNEPLETLTPECVSWCKSIGSSVTNVNDAIADAAVLKAIQAGVDKANEKSVSRAARVQKWSILSADFSIPGGELGPTLKLRRPIVVKKYEKTIEGFYVD